MPYPHSLWFERDMDGMLSIEPAPEQLFRHYHDAHKWTWSTRQSFFSSEAWKALRDYCSANPLPRRRKKQPPPNPQPAGGASQPLPSATASSPAPHPLPFSNASSRPLGDLELIQYKPTSPNPTVHSQHRHPQPQTSLLPPSISESQDQSFRSPTDLHLPSIFNSTGEAVSPVEPSVHFLPPDAIGNFGKEHMTKARGMVDYFQGSSWLVAGGVEFEIPVSTKLGSFTSLSPSLNTPLSRDNAYGYIEEQEKSGSCDF
ncbi:hypothetical protein MMC28_010538 [Mycoblastus sanguinarius]|nr:hypothetical protein [Mycoblastus sanguinarius]